MENKSYDTDIRKKVEKLLNEHSVDYFQLSNDGLDLVISIGGDGTTLYTQSKLEGTPIFPIKDPSRSVGHYSSASKEDFEEKIEKLLSGKFYEDYLIEDYLRLKAEVNGEELKNTENKELDAVALNEILIGKDLKNMLNFDLVFGDNVYAGQRSTGVVVYTPSGWSGYAKSAVGRKIDDGTFSLVCIAPYSEDITEKIHQNEKELYIPKTFVFERNEKVEIINKNDSRIIFDNDTNNRSYKLNKGDSVKVACHEIPARFIRFV